MKGIFSIWKTTALKCGYCGQWKMSVSKWNLFCLKILPNKLFTRNIQTELCQIEHLVPDQLADPCGNTRTLGAVVADFLMLVKSTDSTQLSREICCLSGVWIWNVIDRCLRLFGLTIVCLLQQIFSVGHQWYSQGTLGKYQAWLCDSEGNGKGMGTQVVVSLLRKTLAKEGIGVLGCGRINPKVLLPRGWPT